MPGRWVTASHSVGIQVLPISKRYQSRRFAAFHLAPTFGPYHEYVLVLRSIPDLKTVPTMSSIIVGDQVAQDVERNGHLEVAHQAACGGNPDISPG